MLKYVSRNSYRSPLCKHGMQKYLQIRLLDICWLAIFAAALHSSRGRRCKITNLGDIADVGWVVSCSHHLGLNLLISDAFSLHITNNSVFFLPLHAPRVVHECPFCYPVYVTSSQEVQNVFRLTRTMCLMPFQFLMRPDWRPPPSFSIIINFYYCFLFLVWLNVFLIGSLPLVWAVWNDGYCWIHPCPEGE